ncbi:hypothetical protein A5746_23230 [Mycolicibacterium conceptionense]|uniref:Uncharacterized protein n=1 Tax=Mycolicibacterium conceptionense TaxID=451644 RepID=A0A1A1X238_9MYCO|nr:hypothetical protein AA982_20555 [Mycolicibacterium senegalense]OBB12516.1 hypothetical protein A5718_04935 [Mycolicibacterium conceptionense]OBF12781.1 hypothetical protein A5726_28405 [Mycolicibacterium conceptionense]OBF45296.1 hypothetical protein A5720_10255 [Mycolicibacterium conceptionense]OBH98851.1 hypothetical protein A5716_13180 [Mycolicibacterium conceptionense]
MQSSPGAAGEQVQQQGSGASVALAKGMDLVVVGIDSGQPVGQCAVVDLVTFLGQPADLDVQCLQGVGNAGTRPERAVALA